MENLNDIFNLSLDDFKEPERKQSLIFKPDSKSGKEGVYKAVVRFLPWHQDVKKSVMKKWSCWLTDPATNESKMVDCPSTVGQKSVLRIFSGSSKNLTQLLSKDWLITSLAASVLHLWCKS